MTKKLDDIVITQSVSPEDLKFTDRQKAALRAIEAVYDTGEYNDWFVRQERCDQERRRLNDYS